MMTDTAPPRTGDEPRSAGAEATASVVDLIQLRIRLRALRRLAWLQHLFGDRSRDDLGGAAIAAVLDPRDEPRSEAEWYDQSGVVEAENRGLARVETHLEGEAGARLRQLEATFGLGAAESDLLQTCVAATVDPDLALVLAHLQRHADREYVTEPLVARLFGHGARRPWTEQSALRVWGLIRPAEAAPGGPVPLACDPHILAWLRGTLQLDAALVGSARLIEWRSPLEAWPVEATVRQVRRAMDAGAAVRVVISGPGGSGRRTFAAAVARQFGLSVLAIDTGSIGDADWAEAYMRGQRMAVLGDMAVLWHGEPLDRRPPGGMGPFPLQFAACDPDQLVGSRDGVVDHRLELPDPGLDEQRELWRAMVPEAAAWDRGELEALAARYRLRVGQIEAVARRRPASAEEAGRAARELTRDGLGDLGRLLECPFTWDDLVVRPELRERLEDYAFEAGDRAAFWESEAARRLFPRGRGLIALFSGPPGTGKTMAAQIIAADLQLDLFRVDLASVVSKYIGETAKNLRRIFHDARHMNAVLLFDEADALFSKRTEIRDAHDRYANADTSYLLQLLEEHTGIVILATNKRQNIDPAFTRRVRYVFEFPRPDVAERLRIWRRVIGELTGADTLQRLGETTDRLARTVEMSGAQIKNAVLASLFVARRRRQDLAMPHLVRGIETELGKEGRFVAPEDRERLAAHG